MSKKKVILNSLLLAVICVMTFFGATYFFGNYAGAFQTKVWLDKESDIDFNEEVVLNFSDNMIINNFSNYVEISPKEKATYTWENSNKTLKIKPVDGWKINEEYKIDIKGLKSIFLVSANREITFSTVKYPRVVEFYPKDGAEDVIIDIEGPGSIEFDKSLEDFNLKVRVSPSKKLAYNLNNEKDKISFTFENGYEKGQIYKIILSIKHKKENQKEFKEIYSSSFQSESPPPEEWGKDFTARLDQARKFTKAKISEGKYIDINLAIQVMTIFENGQAVDSFLISSGKRGMDTPKGNFSIINKHPRPWSRQYGLFMPYWMAIVPSGKYGIHELPEWPGGYKEGQNHLGTPVSHGCMRLGVGSAERVYNWAEIGTPVVIY